jgi:hypothetical protein
MLRESVLGITQTENVMQNKNLAITMNAGTNSDRWDTHFLRDLLSKFHWYAFDNDRAGSRLFNSMSVFENSLSAASFETFGAALNSEATHAMDALGCETDVSNNWDIDTCDGGNCFSHMHAAF